ncbi:MAG: hypothetical protein D6719_00795 [Candidatus Dadabacteria bacterium]|nr:MAG: hypothetical protein D6719_00795 [Candidatus Dadabacteria bacterium]
MKYFVRIALHQLAACAVLIPVLIAPQHLNAQNTSETPPVPELLGEEPTPAPTATPVPIPTLSPTLLRNFKVAPLKELSGRVAFTAKIKGYNRILVLDLDSSKVWPLIDGPGNNSYPDWSPDGKKLVFVSDRFGDRDLFLADWEGANQQQLTDNDQNDDNPDWSPDGKSIVYYSETGTGSNPDSNIFMINPDSHEPKQLTHFKGRNTTPRISPDGRYIAYSTNRFWPGWDVCIWDLILKQEKCVLKGAISYCRPTWFQNGTKMFYSAGMLKDVDIGLLTVKSGQRRGSISGLTGREYDVTVGPKKRYIIFAAEEDRDGIFNLYALRLKDGKIKRILSSNYSTRFPSWSAVTTIELEAEKLKALEAAGITPLPSPTPEPSAEDIEAGALILQELEIDPSELKGAKK